MTFGEEGKEGARVHDLKDVEAILDVFQAHGHKEVNRSRSVIAIALLMCYEFKVDTAIAYCGGTSEQYLGKIGWQKRGLIMETKLYPNVVRLFASCLLFVENNVYHPRSPMLAFGLLEDQLSRILRRYDTSPSLSLYSFEYSTSTSRTYASICRFS